MERGSIEIVPIRYFHDLSQIHDGHTIAEILDHAQIMGDKEIGELITLLEVLEKIQDLGLD